MFLKPRSAGVRKIMVPQPVSNIIPHEKHITDASTQCYVEDSKEIFNILLCQNFSQLTNSQTSVFTQGEIATLVGAEAETPIVESILDGMEPINATNTNSSVYGDTLERFIKNMKKACTKDGTPISNFDWSFGPEEYKQTFQKTKETTACGPSGLHMSHWKAAVESETIMKVHSFFIWAAFNFGFSYPRWEESWHCILQKKEYPFSQKMRIIQLFEGDFNAGLKYLLGRLLMWHAHNNKVIDDEVFGSCRGKTGAEALLNLQLLADHSRTWKINMGLLFNDSLGCFDRIPPNLGEIALRRIGCPKMVARSHTKAQRSMRHHIKTTTGVSPGYIKYDSKKRKKICQGVILFLLGLIGGVGQGGGGSPIIWMAILLIMMETYKETQQGAKIINIILKMITKIWVISYVDDNSLVKHFDLDASIDNMINSMQRSLHEWHKILQITGGDLCLEKCTLILMKWKQVGECGNMVLASKKDDEKNLTITSVLDTSNEQQLKRIDPHQAERVLGIRLPLTGKMTIEMNFRKEQLLDFCKSLYKAPLSHYEAHVAYQSRYKSIAKYPFPITTFSSSQLDEIQKPSIRLLLPKLGLNRNMPRAVIFGPRALGGLELMNLKVEQPAINIQTTIGHLR